MTLALESGLPKVSREALVLFGEGVGPSLGRVLLDCGGEVSDRTIDGSDERTRVPSVLLCRKRFLFVLECGCLEVALVSDAAPVVGAAATLAKGLVEAGL